MSTMEPYTKARSYEQKRIIKGLGVLSQLNFPPSSNLLSPLVYCHEIITSSDPLKQSLFTPPARQCTSLMSKQSAVSSHRATRCDSARAIAVAAGRPVACRPSAASRGLTVRFLFLAHALSPQPPRRPHES